MELYSLNISLQKKWYVADVFTKGPGHEQLDYQLPGSHIIMFKSEECWKEQTLHKNIFIELLVVNQVHASQRLACAWFLEIAFVREVGMGVCVDVSAPQAIKNHSCEIKSE